MLSLEHLDKHIAECKRLIEAGEEHKDTLTSLQSLRKNLATASEADWEVYNTMLMHLPDKEADIELIVLRGHLLIEKFVRTFIQSRLPNPAAFERGRFDTFKCIALAESMCLDNKEPKWLWNQIRELNTIRNKLAHSLPNEEVEERIKKFVTTVSNNQNLKERHITNVIARLYGMMKGLCELSEEKEFKIPK